MPRRNPLLVLLAAFGLTSAILMTAGPVRASSDGMVHYFQGGDGSCPSSNLIADAEGNLYGTTFGDGSFDTCFSGFGSVFKLTPNANGAWTLTVLHRFGGPDGANPFAGLIFDQSGNLYGTTWIGGDADAGTVFKLSPGANGTWTETVLHSFHGYPDGAYPYASVVFDASGKNLYGTATGGGEYSCGDVFKLAPDAIGQWNETVLHSFNCKDGWLPYAGVVLDGEANLYGATPSLDSSYCDGNGCGSIFKLIPGTNNEWTYTVLYHFHGEDGNGPVATLLLKAGSLYGTTELGGNLDYCSGQGCGTVFKLSPDGADGTWTETVVHYFDGNDGVYPDSNLISDAAGNLYGTAGSGGQANLGTVFKVSPSNNGNWIVTILQEFNDQNGASPKAVTFGMGGSLYGTTALGGDLNACDGPYGKGCGMVFSLIP